VCVVGADHDALLTVEDPAQCVGHELIAGAAAWLETVVELGEQTVKRGHAAGGHGVAVGGDTFLEPPVF
jgi:hypothetical protein